MTRPTMRGQTPTDAGATRSDRSERPEADRDLDTSPAKQAVANEEKAFESGKENPT
jgi:hypothetical protein